MKTPIRANQSDTTGSVFSTRHIKNSYRPWATPGLTGVCIGVKCPDTPITLISDQAGTAGLEGWQSGSTMETATTYQEHDARLDRLYGQGDVTPAQRARINVCLWRMVQSGGDEYLPDDLANYRRAGLAGERYLADRGLGTEPSDLELAELRGMC